MRFEVRSAFPFLSIVPSFPPSTLADSPSSNLAGLAEALRSELLLYGISVHLFLPATILSPGFEVEQQTKPEITKKIEGPDDGMSPEDVAKGMIAGASYSTASRFCLVDRALTSSHG
jgi:short-subunit dehydrogenase